jgi:hypothetical protein
MTTQAYRDELQALLTPAEHRVFARLNTPQKLQVFLEKLPPNYELEGETYMSPRRALKARTVHCAEAALLAAAVLAYHGRPAWLMDIRALPNDHDHIVTLFKESGLWGAISKSNHAILRWRDPIYRSARELAMTYAHEYILDFGKKSMLAYSKPFSLTRYAPARWVTAEEDLDWLMDELDAFPHEPVAPRQVLARRRRATRVELRSQDLTEHPVPRERRVAKTRQVR